MDENTVVLVEDKNGQLIELPPGFRFNPTDEELITQYLSKKVGDVSFVSIAIGEADFNKCEPWDLPAKAKMGENEWYFFFLRDKKYPNGRRTNRATESGYWKATGKDKEIFKGESLIGLKKTLVFYKGRAPTGDKSNWVMHEYRLEGHLSIHNLPETANTDWVISRIFEKSFNGKSMNVLGVTDMSSIMVQTELAELPPLMDFPQDAEFKNFTISASPDVPCFSNINSYNYNQLLGIHQNPISGFSQINSGMFLHGNYDFTMSMNDQNNAAMTSHSNNNHWPSGNFMPERELMSMSQETGLTTDVNVVNMNNNEISSSAMDTVRPSFEDGIAASASASEVGLVDLDFLWPL